MTRKYKKISLFSWFGFLVVACDQNLAGRDSSTLHTENCQELSADLYFSVDLCDEIALKHLNETFAFDDQALGMQKIHFLAYAGKLDSQSFNCDSLGVDDYGHDAFFFSVYGMSDKSQRLMLKCDLEFNRKDAHGRTVAHIAAATSITKTLQSVNDIDWNIKDRWNRSPIFYAAKWSGKNIPFLIKHGVQFDVLDSSGLSPLHLAVQKGNLSAVKALLGAGANPNLSTDGFTPLFFATDAKKNQSKIVKLLIDYGADTQAVHQGIRAIELLSNYGDKETSNMLILYGK